MDSFKSDEVTIFCNIDTVYSKLSNPESFKAIGDRLPEDAKAKLQQVRFDKDSITITGSPVGEVVLNVVERVAPTRIVLSAAQSPVPLQAVINLEKVSETETRAVAELSVELPVFLRPMVSKPLTEGAKKFGELISQLPYDIM